LSQGQCDDPQPLTLPPPSGSKKCLTTREKLNAVQKLALAIADVLRCNGMTSFKNQVSVLQHLFDCWSQDVNVITATVDHSDVDDQTEDSQNNEDCVAIDVDRDDKVNAGHSGAVEDNDDVNRQTDNECDVVADPYNGENGEVNNSRQTERVSESVDDIGTKPQVGGASDDNVQGRVRILRRNDGAEVSPDTVVYPVARKVRGQPKGTGKTLNRVYKKRQKKGASECD